MRSTIRVKLPSFIEEFSFPGCVCKSFLRVSVEIAFEAKHVSCTFSCPFHSTPLPPPLHFDFRIISNFESERDEIFYSRSVILANFRRCGNKPSDTSWSFNEQTALRTAPSQLSKGRFESLRKNQKLKKLLNAANALWWSEFHFCMVS